jgi:hypothetical protein
MEKILGKLPIDYLQHLYEQKLITENFKINSKRVYEDDDLELYNGEIFRKHKNTGVCVSNYGRIKLGKNIVKQKIEKEGYLYTDILYNISSFDKDLIGKKQYKYRTPIACKVITIDNNIVSIYREKYDEHPYLQIYRNKRGLFFSMDYENKNKYFYKVLTTSTNEKFISIPIYTYRLVAETWIQNPDTKIYNQVHHIINNGYNNTIFNLMWVTYEQHKIIEKRKW